MSDSDIATDLMIRPSPGMKGAFKCGLCGSSEIKVFLRQDEQKVTGIVIACTVCHNTMEFSNGNDSPR